MYRAPCAKFSTRSTPKMSESPAATSHRYMASVRPTRPWKRTCPMQRQRASGLDGWEGGLAVVLVRRRHAQVAEHRHGELRVVLDAAPGHRVDGLVVLLADGARTGRAVHLQPLQRGDHRVDVERLRLLHRLLDRVERRVGGLGDVAR